MLRGSRAMSVHVFLRTLVIRQPTLPVVASDLWIIHSLPPPPTNQIPSSLDTQPHRILRQKAGCSSSNSWKLSRANM